MSWTNMRLLPLAALALLAGAATAAAQQTGDTARAQQLDALLGANADLPKPEGAPPPLFVWTVPQLPPWLAAQPYRQQPLFATVPDDVTVGGRSRRRGSTP